MDREGGNKEKMRKCREWIWESLSISSFSLHFLYISSFSLHFLARRLPGCHNLCNPVHKFFRSVSFPNSDFIVFRFCSMSYVKSCIPLAAYIYMHQRQSRSMNHLALLNPAKGITTRNTKTQWQHIYFVLELLVMALVPSDTACLSSSPGRIGRTLVWISCCSGPACSKKNFKNMKVGLSIGVIDTLSDSIQCLNVAKKWFIQYSIQYRFTQDLTKSQKH